jgi:hypothetical protein
VIRALRFLELRVRLLLFLWRVRCVLFFREVAGWIRG